MNLMAYRQQQVDNVHQTQYNVRNIIKTVDIGRGQESAGEDVVSQHLVVILSPFFHVDNQDLLEPE